MAKNADITEQINDGSGLGERPAYVDPTIRLDRRDAALAVASYIAAFGLYAPFALRLAQGRYLDYYNLAFDFDPYRTLQTLALSPADLQGFKHPLIVLLRPFAWGLVNLGLDSKQAAVLEMVIFGSGTVVLCFLFLRLATVKRAESLALTLLFSLTSTQIITSIITESYGFSNFAITFVWLVALVRLQNPRRLQVVRLAGALLALGVTLTNVMQPFVAESLVWWRHGGVRQMIRRTATFALVLGIVTMLLVIAVWLPSLWIAAHHPIVALKEIWWLQTKGPRTGILGVLEAFFGFSFVSPHYSWILLPEGTVMRDFRVWSFSPLGRVSAPFWLLFFAFGAIAGARHQSYRWVILGLGITVIFNVLFHMHFQFRGSLFIYAAHLHFPIFAIGAGMAPRVSACSLKARSIYIVTILALALPLGANNLHGIAQFVTAFDTVNTPCPAPCAEGSPQIK